MMAINNYMSPEGDQTDYDQAYRRMLETMMGFLRTHVSTTTRPLDPYITVKYKGDLYGFLTAAGIEKGLHWLIMRMNDMNAPTDFDNRIKILLIPYDKFIQEIKLAYLTVTTKIT